MLHVSTFVTLFMVKGSVPSVFVYRAEELSSLKGRKYLDALCVYFWATTPVLISILTFTTYVALGHKLTAAKVGPSQEST